MGYENATKALLTVVKELLDNSLDATNEAGILPDIKISVQEAREVFIIKDFSGSELGKVTRDGGIVLLVIGGQKLKPVEKKEPSKKEAVYVFKDGEGAEYKFKIYQVEKEDKNGSKAVVEQYEFFKRRTEMKVSKMPPDRYLVIVEDNGPGIREDKVPYAFGKLLYGSKFYRLRQSRGIQGLGGHGAVLYSQLTTGKPVKITTSIGREINTFELMINVSKNEPHIIKQDRLKNTDKWHGLKVEMELEGRYIEGRQSISEYIKQTHMANPYVHLIFNSPNGTVEYKRLVGEIPKQPKEIKPHPYGVEIGVLRRMLHTTKARNLIGFLTGDFSRVGKGTAAQMLKTARIDAKKKPIDVTHEESERLHKAMQQAKLMSPPTNCLSPLGEKLLEEGLKKDTGAEFVVAVTRPPSVYRGNPFAIEVAMSYGGNLPPDQTAQLFRFANKVPLLYHQSDCVTSESVREVDFRRYGFGQPGNSIPVGPLAILIHFASVWVPFTSEGKQAIASYDEILKEIKLALQDAGRKLSIYVRQKAKHHDAQMRRELFEKYIPELAESLEKLTDVKKQKIIDDLEKIAKKGRIKEDEIKAEETKGENEDVGEKAGSKEEPKANGK